MASKLGTSTNGYGPWSSHVLLLLLSLQLAYAVCHGSTEAALLPCKGNEGCKQEYQGTQSKQQDPGIEQPVPYLREPPRSAQGPQVQPYASTTAEAVIQGPRRALQQGYWSAGPRWPWQVNGFVGYFATPVAAGSASVSGDAKAELFYDGTIKGGAGFATSTSLALGRAGAKGDSFGVGNPRYDRPYVATQAYVTVPRWLGWTTFPTLGYTLAEGQGSTASANQGYFVVSELAYNPLSNSFGLSLSQAQSNAISVPALLPGSGWAANQGFSGLEQIGGANSLTLFTDPRTIQFAQAVAYPFSILTPGNPLTCTQTMINSVAWTWGDLGGPVRPTPRNQPIFLVPFCAEFFNGNSFDNFHLFIQDYLDYYYGYDDAYYQDYGLQGDLPGGVSGNTAQPRSAASNNSKKEKGKRGKQLTKEGSATAAGGADLTGSAYKANNAPAGNESSMGNAQDTSQANSTSSSTCIPADPTTAFLRSAVEIHAPSPAVPKPLSIRNSTAVHSGTAVPQASSTFSSRSMTGGSSSTLRSLKSEEQGTSSRNSRRTRTLPNKYAAISLHQAGFGDLETPISLTQAGAEPFTAASVSPRPQFSPQLPTQAPVGTSTMSNSNSNSRDSVKSAVTGAQNQTMCAPHPVKSNVTQGLNLTTPLGPAMLVARTPGQMFPVAFRQSAVPSTQDMTALVALAGVLTQQLQQLPMGRLARGVATTAVGAISNVSEAVMAEARGPLSDAWNLTNQVARLGAQVAMQSFLSSAGAVLPITRAIYNRSSSWYRAAAAASNHAVDNAIADLSDQQQVLGDFAGTLATALQQLTFNSASAAANGYAGSGPAGILSNTVDTPTMGGASDAGAAGSTTDTTGTGGTTRKASVTGGVQPRMAAPVPR